MLESVYDSTPKRNKILKLRLRNIESYIFAFCLFMSAPPFFIWHSISALYFILICSLLAIKNNGLKSQIHFVYFVMFFFIYLFIFIKNDTTLFGYISIMFVPTLFVSSSDFLSKIFKAFINLYSFFLIPSIIIFIIVFIVGIDLPHTVIQPLNELKDYKYLQYPFLIYGDQVYKTVFPRFYGYFDEPGVIGTISSVILLSSKFNLKKLINIPIFIAGLLSFSLVFYILLVTYGFIIARFKYKIITFFVIIITLTLLKDNQIFNGLIMDRISYENAELPRNSRSVKGFDTWFKQYAKTDEFYFGLGTKESRRHNPGGSYYKDLIVSYGVLTFILFTTLLTIRAFYKFKFKKEFIIYVVILIFVLYQRPYITNYLYMFLLIAPVPYLSKKDELFIT